MKISCVKAVFFSTTENTKNVVRKIAEVSAHSIGVEVEEIDYTLPRNRKIKNIFKDTDLVIFGSPIYAGRIPNKMVSYIREGFEGRGALAVPIVTFGNRSYGDGLLELRNILEANGFHTIAAGAFSAEHAFSNNIAGGRPDKKDMGIIVKFAKDISKKTVNLKEIIGDIALDKDGEPGPYYKPLGLDGNPAIFLKAKPKTDLEKCIECGLCAELCPMGSIDKLNYAKVDGVCIKCHSCVRKCPVHAKYFDDEAFLSHVSMLEHNYTTSIEPSIFI